MCRADLYVVLTPDRDIYVEELGLLNAHVRNIRVRPHPGVAPPGVAAAEIYAMPAFAVDEMNEFLDEARTLADQERAMMAVGGPAAASLAGAGAAAPAGLQPGAGQPQSFEALDGYLAGILKWLATHSADSFADGGWWINFRFDGGDYHRFMQKPAQADHRVLALELNALGQPERSLREVASLSQEVKMKWSVAGPRTARLRINYLAVEGLGFEGHDERLRQVTKADASSWGIQEHFQVSNEFEAGVVG